MRHLTLFAALWFGSPSSTVPTATEIEAARTANTYEMGDPRDYRPRDLTRVYDREHGVVCYFTGSTHISCVKVVP